MKAKIKWTPQRLAVLKYLDNNREHPSADDIHMALSKDYPTMSVATVYNVLEFLKETGRVKEINIDPEKRRFDPILTSHHHAYCVRCKKIFDISVDIDLPDLSSKLPDFQIIDTEIRISVLCAECKEKGSLKFGVKEFRCKNCGSIKQAKHKPQKCPTCGQRGTFESEL